MLERFEIRSGLKYCYALSPLLFNFGLKYTVLIITEDINGVTLNYLNQLFVRADDG